MHWPQCKLFCSSANGKAHGLQLFVNVVIDEDSFMKSINSNFSADFKALSIQKVKRVSQSDLTSTYQNTLLADSSSSKTIRLHHYKKI